MQKLAVVIGIEEYRDQMVSRLRFAHADAREFALRLRESCRFDTVRLLAESSGDGEPTLHNILLALRGVASDLKKDDLFLFYFAGHGIEQDKCGYLMASDTMQAYPEYGSLSFDLLRKNFASLAARQRIILLDACRNDPTAARSSAANFMSESISRDILAAAQSHAEEGTTTVLLTACRSGQRAYEWPERGHGVFTHFLIEGIDSGELDMDDLAAYTCDRVRAWSLRAPGVARPQEPWFEKCGEPRVISLIGSVSLPGDLELPIDASSDRKDAEKFLTAGDLEKALASVKAGLAKDPLSYDLRRLKREIESEINQANTKLIEKERKTAEKRSRQLVADAKKFESEGDLESAMACLEKAQKLGVSGDAAAELVRIKMVKQNDKRSVVDKLSSLFETAGKLEVNDPLGALALYQEALKVYPGNTRAKEGVKRSNDHHERGLLKTLIDQHLATERSSVKESEAIVTQLTSDLKLYESLTMVKEAVGTKKELERETESLMSKKHLVKFYSGLSASVDKAGSVNEAKSEAFASNNLRQAALDYVFSDHGADAQVLYALFPTIVDAKVSFQQWLKTVYSSALQRNNSIVGWVFKQPYWETLPLPPALSLIGDRALQLLPETSPEGVDLTEIRNRISSALRAMTPMPSLSVGNSNSRQRRTDSEQSAKTDATIEQSGHDFRNGVCLKCGVWRAIADSKGLFCHESGQEESPVDSATKVTFKSIPSGANIFVGGKLVGVSPARVVLKAGEYMIRAEKLGFEVWLKNIPFDGSRSRIIQIRLRAQEQSAILSIESSPSGADVFIRGKRSGTAPFSISLKRGSYLIHAEKAGFGEIQELISFEGTRNTTLKLELKPSRARGQSEHRYVSGVCQKCGCSEVAVKQFGFKCK